MYIQKIHQIQNSPIFVFDFLFSNADKYEIVEHDESQTGKTD